MAHRVSEICRLHPDIEVATATLNTIGDFAIDIRDGKLVAAPVGPLRDVEGYESLDDDVFEEDLVWIGDDWALPWTQDTRDNGEQ